MSQTLSRFLLLISLLFITAFSLSAQCPTITVSNSDLPGGEVCEGDMITFSVEGENLPDGGTIDWYIGDGNYNPYNGGGTFIGSSDIEGGSSTTITPCMPCPTVVGALIDACVEGGGGEADNEFMLINSGGGFAVNDFYVDFPFQNNNMPPFNDDINTGEGCNWQFPNPTLMANLTSDPGCGGTFVAVGPGDEVPASAVVIFFPSAGQTFNMDLSAFCATGQTAYVMQSDCDRGAGALSNASSSGIREFNIGLSCCNTLWLHDTDAPGLSGSNGDFVIVDEFGNNTYTNNGCVSPAVETVPPPDNDTPATVNDFSYTIDDTSCGQTPNITGIVNPLTPGCPQTFTSSFGFNVICPVDGMPADLFACSSSSTAFFDLTEADNMVNGNSGESVVYYLDPTTNNPVGNPTNFESANGGQVFALVGDSNNPQCPGTPGTVTLNIINAPPANAASASACDDGTGTAAFDLTAIIPDVNNQPGTGVDFYLNSDGTGFINSNPFTTSTTVIYAVVNDFTTGCLSDPVPITLTVEDGPNQANTGLIISPTEACGSSDVDLTFTLPGTATYDVTVEITNTATTTQVFSVVNGETVTVPNVSENTTFTLLQVSSGGCVGAVNHSENFTITSTGTATISGNDNICQGETLTLTVTFDSGTAPFNFVLLTNGGSPLNFTNNPNAVTTIDVMPAFNAEYTLLNASAGGCDFAVDGEVDVTVNPAPQAVISGDATICAGENADIQIDFTGNAPHTFVYRIDNIAQPPITTNDNPYILNVSPGNTSTYTLFSYEDAGCEGTVSSSAEVTVSPAPNAEIIADGTICSGETYNLEIFFTGNAPFTFVYNLNGTPQAAQTTSDNPFILQVAPTETTVYSLESVASGTCTGAILGGPAVVTVSEAPDFTLISDDCNGLEYTVVFEITGGTAPYTVNGSTDGISGNTYTSDPIPSGTAYNFIIDDANNCGPVSVADNNDCDCFTDSGTMTIPNPPLMFCEGEAATGLPNGDEDLESDDILGYIIHTSPNPALSNPNIYSPTPTFAQSGFLTTGTVYYISAVAGNNDGSGNADFADDCLSVAAGTPVMWTEAPTGTVSAPDAVCAGEDAMVTFNFTGTPPFAFSYTVNGNTPVNQTTNSNSASVDITVNATTTVVLTEISAGACTVENVNDEATINAAPEVAVNSEDFICADDNTSYQYTFALTGTEPFNVVGTGGNFSANVFTSVPIMDEGTYFFEISDANGCNTVIIEGAEGCEFECTTVLGDMEQDPITNCVGSPVTGFYDDTDEVLDDDDIVQFILHSTPDETLGEVFFTNNTPTFAWDAAVLEPNVIYYISAIAGNDDGTGNVDLDDPCLVITEGQPVIWDQSNATLIGMSQSICGEDCVDFVIELDGIGNVTFEITGSNGEDDEFTTFEDSFTYTVCPTTETTYTLSSVGTQTCPGIVNTPNSVTISPSPLLMLENINYNCSDDNSTYFATFQITGGTPPYALTSGAGSILGSFVTTDDIPNETFTVYVVEDANGCEVEVALFTNCNCFNDAGELDVFPILNACFDEEITAVVDEDPIFQFGDILQYALHDLPNQFLGTVFDISDDPTFGAPDGYVSGQTYYISAIVGMDDGTGNVNLDDFCLSVSPGVPVVWYDPPFLEPVPQDTTICEGDCYDLQYNFSGGGPYSLDLAIQGVTSPYNTNDEFLIIQICPEDYDLAEGESIEFYPVSLMNPGCLEIYTADPQAVITDLFVAAPDTSATMPMLCTGDTFELGGQIFDADNPTGEVTLQNAIGCDSLVTVALEFVPQPEGDFNPVVCEGDSFSFEGETFDADNLTGSVLLPDASFLGCDSLVNVTLDFYPQPEGDLDTIICQGDSFTFEGETFDADNTSGSVLLTDASFLGCDSLVNVTLDFYPQPEGDLDTIICQGDSFTFEGETFDADNLTGSVLLPEASFLGCDSLVNVTLDFYPQPEGDLDTIICQGDSFTFEGETFDADNTSGSVLLSDASFLGCDSLVNVTLDFYPQPEGDLDTIICQGDSFTFEGETFDADNTSGSVLLPDASFLGCDSLVNVTLDFYPQPEGDLMQALCPGGSLELGGEIFDEDNPSGSVLLPDASFLGCDSLVNVTLTFGDEVFSQIDTFVCEGGSAVINGTTYDADNLSGSLTLDDASYLGCDSTIFVNLFFYPPAVGSTTVDLCEGGSVEIGGQIFDADNPSGPAILENASFNGCDSTVNVTVQFFDEIIFNLDGIYCPDAVFTVDTEIFDIDNPTGLVIFENGSFLGCDSIVEVDLEFFAPAVADINPFVCEGENFIIDGEIFDVNNPTGTVILDDASVNGCDSTVNVTLGFYENPVTDLTQMLCTGGSLEVGDEIFDESNPTGSVLFENGSFNGCDSTVNVILTFVESVENDLDLLLCEGEIAIINGTEYGADNLTGTELFENGSYLGCDSIVNVSTSFYAPAVAEINETLCPGESLQIEGETYDADNPTGTQILDVPSAAGCDSIAVVSLTFLENTFGTLDTVLCTGESVVINGTTLNEANSTAVFTFENAAFNGCDSILTMNATFTPPTTGTLEINLEPGESVTVGTTVFDLDNPSGTVTLPGAAVTGCDSIVTVNLTFSIDFSATGFETDCFSDNNGNIVIDTIFNGTPPFIVTVDGENRGTFSNFPIVLTGFSAGNYEVGITGSADGFGSQTVNVPAADAPFLFLGDDQEILQGESYLIDAATNLFDFEILRWTPTDSLDNDTTTTVLASPSESTVYTLFLQDSLGCSVSDDILITVNREARIYVPNAFSPNDDGINDAFTIYADARQVLSIQSLMIFDRWGNLVFQNEDFAPNDPNLGWNGRMREERMNNAVFVYTARVLFVDGRTEVIRGDVTLVR